MAEKRVSRSVLWEIFNDIETLGEGYYVSFTATNGKYYFIIFYGGEAGLPRRRIDQATRIHSTWKSGNLYVSSDQVTDWLPHSIGLSPEGVVSFKALSPVGNPFDTFLRAELTPVVPTENIWLGVWTSQDSKEAGKLPKAITKS
jgi:hypothetical protein